MKNRLKRVLIASLSTVCLLANHQANGMEKEEAESSQGSGCSSQQQLVTFDITSLSSFMSHEQIERLLSLRVTPPAEQELKSLQSSGIAPQAFNMDLIRNLSLKYQGVLSKAVWDMSEESHKDLAQFLMVNKHFIESSSLEDATIPILVLKMINENFVLDSQLDRHILLHSNTYWHLHNAANYARMMMNESLGGRHGKIIVRLDKFWGHLKYQITFPQGCYYSPHAAQGSGEQITLEQISQNVRQDINSKFSFPGYTFDIERDGESVSRAIETWFPVVRQLAVFERAELKPQLNDLRRLQKSYAFVENQLEKLAAQQQQAPAALSFSGVTHSFDQIALVRGSQPLSLEQLKAEVNERKQEDEKKLSERKPIENKLSSLNKLVQWIDDVVGDISKNGRIS
jgi:hypothetical protein